MEYLNKIKELIKADQNQLAIQLMKGLNYTDEQILNAHKDVFSEVFPFEATALMSVAFEDGALYVEYENIRDLHNVSNKPIESIRKLIEEDPWSVHKVFVTLTQ